MVKSKAKKKVTRPRKNKVGSEVSLSPKSPRRKTGSRKPARRAVAPTTAGLRWFSGNTQRLGTITQAFFTADGILRLEIDCDYRDVSHYSIVFDRQGVTNPQEYYGRWSSNDANRSTGEVSVTLTGKGRVFRLAGTWAEYGENGNWESTSEIVIARRL